MTAGGRRSRHCRRPSRRTVAARIEAFAELHPAPLRAADAVGWRRAMTAPVLTLSPEALAPAPPVAGAFRWLAPDETGRIEATLRGAFARGVPSIWLSVVEGALELYEDLGFVRVGTQVNLESP